jgi:hypothetical protein
VASGTEWSLNLWDGAGAQSPPLAVFSPRMAGSVVVVWPPGMPPGVVTELFDCGERTYGVPVVAMR